MAAGCRVRRAGSAVAASAAAGGASRQTTKEADANRLVELRQSLLERTAELQSELDAERRLPASPTALRSLSDARGAARAAKDEAEQCRVAASAAERKLRHAERSAALEERTRALAMETLEATCANSPALAEFGAARVDALRELEAERLALAAMLAEAPLEEEQLEAKLAEDCVRQAALETEAAEIMQRSDELQACLYLREKQRREAELEAAQSAREAAMATEHVMAEIVEIGESRQAAQSVFATELQAALRSSTERGAALRKAKRARKREAEAAAVALSNGPEVGETGEAELASNLEEHSVSADVVVTRHELEETGETFEAVEESTSPCPSVCPLPSIVVHQPVVGQQPLSLQPQQQQLQEQQQHHHHHLGQAQALDQAQEAAVVVEKPSVSFEDDPPASEVPPINVAAASDLSPPVAPAVPVDDVSGSPRSRAPTEAGSVVAEPAAESGAGSSKLVQAIGLIPSCRSASNSPSGAHLDPSKPQSRSWLSRAGLVTSPVSKAERAASSEDGIQKQPGRKAAAMHERSDSMKALFGDSSAQPSKTDCVKSEISQVSEPAKMGVMPTIVSDASALHVAHTLPVPANDYDSLSEVSATLPSDSDAGNSRITSGSNFGLRAKVSFARKLAVFSSRRHSERSNNGAGSSASTPASSAAAPSATTLPLLTRPRVGSWWRGAVQTNGAAAAAGPQPGGASDTNADMSPVSPGVTVAWGDLGAGGGNKSSDESTGGCGSK
eukprot:TRINITY_DN2754_c2_g1_i1.p1 TRINITY_DN2754_c2_g1~~TRINITY_DN2754_c2_g1_i1.p1  ORF type:complete len:744 (-),score=175.58 TRINITY_DN2754_c2_g1_i1:113-2311(-)